MATRMDRASATTTMVARSRQKGSVEKKCSTETCGFRLLVQIGSKDYLRLDPMQYGR